MAGPCSCVPGYDDEDFAIRISSASFVPFVIVPPTNTRSPVLIALAVTLLPAWRTTVVLVMFHVQVVPSAAVTVMAEPVSDFTVPRSKATVRGPALPPKVTSPCSPPTRARRARGLVQKAWSRRASRSWSLLSAWPTIAEQRDALVPGAVVPADADADAVGVRLDDGLTAAEAPPVIAMPMAVPPASSTALAALVVTTRRVLPDQRGRRGRSPGSIC